jgi:hypothetical protein
VQAVTIDLTHEQRSEWWERLKKAHPVLAHMAVVGIGVCGGLIDHGGPVHGVLVDLTDPIKPKCSVMDAEQVALLVIQTITMSDGKRECYLDGQSPHVVNLTKALLDMGMPVIGAVHERRSGRTWRRGPERTKH